jgi:hypothetical protein
MRLDACAGTWLTAALETGGAGGTEGAEAVGAVAHPTKEPSTDKASARPVVRAQVAIGERS